MTIKSWQAFGFFLASLSMAGGAALMTVKPAPDPVAFYVASPKIKAAMRYHGILCAHRQDGQWVFERDGQTCKLYTEGFNAHWARLSLAY